MRFDGRTATVVKQKEGSDEVQEQHEIDGVMDMAAVTFGAAQQAARGGSRLRDARLHRSEELHPPRDRRA